MCRGSRMPTELFTCLVAKLAACCVVALMVLPALFTAPHVLFMPSKSLVLFEPCAGAALPVLALALLLLLLLLLCEAALCVGVELLLLQKFKML